MRTKFLPYPFIFLLLLLGYSCKKDEAKSPDPILNISRTNLEVGNDVGYTDTLVIQSNIDWTISLSDGANAWLSVDPVTKATGDTTIITVKVIAANTAPTQTATLTISNTGKILWQKTFGSSASDSNTGITAGADGSILVTNIVTGNDGDVSGNHGKRDGWIFKLQ